MGNADYLCCLDLFWYFLCQISYLEKRNHYWNKTNKEMKNGKLKKKRSNSIINNNDWLMHNDWNNSILSNIQKTIK